MPLSLSMPIYSNFQLNRASGETGKPPDPLSMKQNRGSGDFRVSPKAPFNWKLLQIGILSDKGMGKNYPIFEVGVAFHAPPPPLELEILHISDFELCLRIPQH